MTQINGYVASNFKETEIGVIPADWDAVKLNQVVTFTHKPRNLDLSRFDTIPFIPMELIPDEGIFSEQYILKDPNEISSGNYCETGDLLLAKITPSFENGKQAIVHNIPLEFAYATTEIFAIKPLSDKLDSLFLFDYLKLPHVRADIAGRMEGTTGRQRVPRAVIENYYLPLPPLPEQRRIAAVLKAIQDEIATQDDIITEAREFKRSLMHRLFTYGAGAEPAETKETEIGEFPAHWEMLPLGELCELKYGYQTSIPKTMPPNGTWIISTAEIKNEGYLDISKIRKVEIDEALVQKFLVRKDDILFNWRNSQEHVGKTAVVEFEPLEPMIFASFIVRIRPQRNITFGYIHFLLTCLRDRGVFFQLSRRAVNQANFNANQLGELKIPVPTIDEQNEIALRLTATDQKLVAEEDRKAAMQDFFKTMLHQLMTGQIRLFSDEGLPLTSQEGSVIR